MNLALRSLVLAGCMAVTSLAATEQRPPNLLVVIVDDLGYADTGFQGSKDIPTPRLDALAAQGVRFDAAYVTYTVCSPSRAGLMSGRYPQRFGYERNVAYKPNDPKAGFSTEERTLAEALRERGYTSGVIGKWHLGAQENFHPLNRGFDHFFGHLGGGHRYFPEEWDIRTAKGARNETESYRTWLERDGEPVEIAEGGYLTDILTDDAVGFIEKNAEKPFFLYLSYNAPHSPLQARQQYLDRVAGITDPKRRTYAAMIAAVDDGVGRVLDTLDSKGIADNTIVVFLSDNGGPIGESGNGSVNTPLRGGKGAVWEGGWRVPFVMRWTGKLPAGRTYGHPISSLDIYATIAELAGVTPDPQRPLDGVNLIPFLTGEKTGRPHAAIYMRMFDRGAWAIRLGDYKLLQAERDRPARLYELRSDPGEQKDLAPSRPDIVAELQRRWNAWSAQLIEPQFEGLMTSQPANRPQPAATSPAPQPAAP